MAHGRRVGGIGRMGAMGHMDGVDGMDSDVGGSPALALRRGEEAFQSTGNGTDAKYERNGICCRRSRPARIVRHAKPQLV